MTDTRDTKAMNKDSQKEILGTPKKMGRFTIDFFELAFLAGACIPPVPIARGSFWRNMIEQYYHEMTPNERRKIHEWLNRDLRYEDGLEKNIGDVIWFEKRYDPNNQYLVHILYKGKEETHECFKNGDRYWTSTTRFIAPEFITKVEKL
jgi:hypothetical protein